MIHQESIQIETSGRGTYDITRHITDIHKASGIVTGLCNIFIRHTSASVIICENADPDVRKDLDTFMSKLVLDGDPDFIHTTEGKDDMPAHVRSILTASSITIPVSADKVGLGIWQGVFLYEHRRQGHKRTVMVTVYGEA